MTSVDSLIFSQTHVSGAPLSLSVASCLSQSVGRSYVLGAEELRYDVIVHASWSVLLTCEGWCKFLEENFTILEH